MVSFKALTLLTLSISAATAIPQYGHARLHVRATGTDADLQDPTNSNKHHHHHHHHKQNETECGAIEPPTGSADVRAVKESGSPCMSTHTAYVTSTEVATVTAELKRWERSGRRTRTVYQNSQTQPQNTNAGTAAGTYGAGSGSTATASADSSVPSSGSSNVTSSGGKKGLSYNTNSLLNQFSGASWAYNWAAGPGGNVPSGVEYVPMLWGEKGISAWSSAVNTAIASGSKHVLSFNEPDFPQQANIGAANAAKLHIANVAPLRAKGVKIGSPAITNSNIAGQGLDWMKSFLSACGGSANNCQIDFLAFHWYNNPETMPNFKSHVNSVIQLAKANGIPKVWLTEFAVNGGSDAQAAFVKEAIPFLESTPEVERYAYFMVGNGQMLTNGALNVVGKAYNN